MATNWDMLRAHYLQANRATQLESLALNLMRIQLLACSGTEETVAQYLVRESQFFIEWVVPTIDLEADMAFATDLVDLQRLLSRWKLNWSERWTNESHRQEIATLTQQWCDRLRRVG